MNRSERHRYYASREWAILKEQVRERSGGRCERCGNRPYEQTHHLTYERLGNELLEDLQGLCTPCHEYVSGKRHEDPALPAFDTRPRYEHGAFLICPRGHRGIEITGAHLSRTGANLSQYASITVCRCRQCDWLAGGDAGQYALIQRGADADGWAWGRWVMFDPAQVVT